jgi:hypothetical protein
LNNSHKSKLRFSFILLAILLISVAVFYAVSVPRHMGEADAKDGTLDLSGADFNSTLYPLNGEWELYYGKLYTPEDFANGSLDDMELVKLPAGWLDMGYSVPAHGTFRLTLKTGEARRLMLHVPEIADAGVVWLNGEKVYDAGEMDADGVSARSIQNGFAALGAKDGVTEIVIQAASGPGFALGGLTYSACVGSESLLLGDAMFRRVMLAGVIGAILMMALYHFVLFLGSRKDKIYLWYVLYVLVIALRMSMESNGLIQLFARNGMNDLLGRIYFACFAAQVLFLTLFTFEVFRIPYLPRKTIWRVVYAVGGGILILNIVLFLASSAAPDALVYLCILPFALLIIMAMSRVIKERQQPYMGLYLVALFLFFFWGTGAKLLADNTFFVPAVLSNVFMALTQTVVLSVNYAENRRRARYLAAKTDFYRRMSHDLRTPLTKISTNIQIVNHQESIDHERLTKSQDEIMRMSEMIDDALEDRGESEGDK